MRIVEISQYQKRFYIEWKINPNSTSYNTPLIYEIHGNLNLNALEYALKVFIHRYDEGCRSYFIEQNETIKQVILDAVNLEIEVHDISDVNQDITYLKEQFIHKASTCIFDLSKTPLYKFALAYLSKNHYVLVLNFHHIITDATTAQSFVNIISNLYNSYNENDTINQEHQISILNKCVSLAKEQYDDKQKENDLIYWENLLRDTELYLDLPKKNTINNIEQSCHCVYFDFDKEQTNQLLKLTKRLKSTLFIIMAGIYGVILLRYANQKSLVLNYPVNMRPHGFRDKTGCFVNNILFKINIEQNYSFENLFHSLTQQRKNTKKHQRCSLLDIVQNLRNKQLLKRNEFFNIDFFEAYLDLIPLKLNHLDILPVKPIFGDMPNDIGLAYQFSHECIRFKLEYKVQLFDADFANNFIYIFKKVVNEIVKNDQLPVYGFSLLSEHDYQLLKKNGNKSNFQSNNNISICSIFEEKVLEFPNKIAVEHNNECISYRDLNAKANQLARVLKENGVRATTLVGIYLERSIEMIIAMMAILKAGGAYIPLDPQYPSSRLKDILIDSKLKVIITQSTLRLESTDPAVKFINVDDLHCLNQQINTNLMPLSCLISPAYVIYTSGSTGKPKGVVISHLSLLNHNKCAQKIYKINSNDNVLQLSTANFDISVEEIFPTLISGATLIIYPYKEGLSIKLFQQTIKEKKITLVNLPTAFWHTWSSELNIDSIEHLKSLRLVVVGGEQPNTKVLSYWNSLVGENIKWINTYGPTEGTIISSQWEFSPSADSIPEIIPIGIPIDNCQIYITDHYLNPLPMGMTGELLLAGVNLAICYLNYPELTAEKFIPNPFSNRPGDRLYRTGDLAKLKKDGTIEYVGRIDQQIKIRGYRVELGEVEANLMVHKNVKQVIVINQNMNETPVLIAFIITVNNEKMDVQEFKSYLSKKLPDYMIPHQFVLLDKFPVNSNGKINKKILYEYKVNKTNNIVSISPETQIEKEIHTIWQQTLNNNSIGLEDNFFDLGGHSLLILKIHKQIEEKFNINIPVVFLFQYPTIKSLANKISTHNKNPISIIEINTNAKKQRIAIEKQKKLFNRRLMRD